MSFYKIKKSDKNYIQALVKYCKDVPILTIEVDDRQTVRKVDKKNLTCKDLPTLLPTIQDDEFVITCSDYLTLEYVFPPVDTDKLTAGTPEISNQEMSILDGDILSGYFKTTIKHEELDQEVFISHDGYSEKLVEARANLNKTEAILLLQQIDEKVQQMDKKYKVTNVLFLPEQETFIFRVNHNNFCLRFGKHTCFDRLESLMFDIDRGFRVGSWPPEAAKKLAFITDVLNVRFNQWKKSGYTGDLFAADQTGLVETVAARASAQPIVRGLFDRPGVVAQQDAVLEKKFGY